MKTTIIKEINQTTGKITSIVSYVNNLPIEENAALYLASLHKFPYWWNQKIMERYRKQIKVTPHGNAFFEYEGKDYLAISE